jgi:hypothetical protein
MADFSVRLKSSNNFTVTQGKTIVMAEFLSDLADVSVSNLPTKDNYVLAYDATLQKYTLVPADQVLQSAVEDSQLPQEFINQLDADLDDKIDLDAGSF